MKISPNALAITVALFYPLSMVATPLLMATAGDGHEAKVLKQGTVTTWPGAFGVAVLGLLLVGIGGYMVGVAAGARAGLPRPLIASREGELGAEVVELARFCVRLVGHSRPSGAVSGAICTTAPNSDLWP